MFNFSKHIPSPRPSLARMLNGVIDDLVGHGGNLAGLRFVAQGSTTAYLKVPGDPKGAVVVSFEEGDPQVVVFLHQSRTGKEAFDMSKDEQGCKQLCADEDMEEERFLSKCSVSTPTGVPAGLYDVVAYCGRKFASFCGKSDKSPFGANNPEDAYL